MAVLVSDRHDNILMDPVARPSPTWPARRSCSTPATTPRPGRPGRRSASSRSTRPSTTSTTASTSPATTTTATSSPTRPSDLGFTTLDGEVVEGPDGMRLLGVGDPRSSGLGNWRDETGLSFDEVSERLADAACAADEDGERVSTLLVHDADSGTPALERGCVDLVVAGHLHEVVGPDAGRGRRRPGRLHVHDRDDRRGGVRDRDRDQAAAGRDGVAGDLPRRPAGRRAVGDALAARRPRGRDPWTPARRLEDRDERLTRSDPPADRRVEVWRRWRDLNPREGFALNPLSRRAP